MAKLNSTIDFKLIHSGKPWHKSKKAWALIAGLAGVAATMAGVAIPPMFFWLILGYLGSQGVADIGKEKLPDMVKNALEDAVAADKPATMVADEIEWDKGGD